MNDQKLENLLNLALDATPEELERSERLSEGYDRADNTWDLIIKYNEISQSWSGKGRYSPRWSMNTPL